MYYQSIAYQVSHKRSYQSTGSYIQAFSLLSTRCHGKGPTNLQVLIYGFLLYGLPGDTQKVLKIYRFLYRVFCVLSTLCHTKGPTNLEFLIYRFFVYCVPGVTQKVLPIYIFLYTGFQFIVYQLSHKRSYQSTGSHIWVFSVLYKRCHTKDLTNLQVPIYRILVSCLAGVTQKVPLIYKFLYTGFQCIAYQVSQKRFSHSTGSYIWIFNVLSARSHTKGPANLHVLIYGFLLYCLPGVTQMVLPIYRFLYTCFYCIGNQVLHKRSYQSTGSYIRAFSVLLIRCHTKGPTNLLFLIYLFLAYCLQGVTQKVLRFVDFYRFLYTGLLLYSVPGVTQKVLPIQRFLYTGFQCIVYQVSHKRSYQSTCSYIQVFVYCLPGVTQKILPIYRFLCMGFQHIVYQVSHKR